MFIAALFTTAKKGKQLKCPSMDEWIKKIWYIHRVEYYSALKKKEVLSHTTSCRNLWDIMLSEINLTQKDKYCMIPLI